MSIGRRIAALFRVKADKALDRAEDPREVLDYSYEQQLEMVVKVRRGVADVATSRKRVELQLTQLQLSAGKLQDQAQQALGAGREDLARAALIRRAAVTSQISDLQGQQASLQAEEDKTHPRRAAAAGEGGCIPDPQGNHQGRLHRRRGTDPHRGGGRWWPSPCVRMSVGPVPGVPALPAPAERGSTRSTARVYEKYMKGSSGVDGECMGPAMPVVCLSIPSAREDMAGGSPCCRSRYR